MNQSWNQGMVDKIRVKMGQLFDHKVLYIERAGQGVNREKETLKLSGFYIGDMKWQREMFDFMFY